MEIWKDIAKTIKFAENYTEKGECITVVTKDNNKFQFKIIYSDCGEWFMGKLIDGNLKIITTLDLKSVTIEKIS